MLALCVIASVIFTNLFDFKYKFLLLLPLLLLLRYSDAIAQFVGAVGYLLSGNNSTFRQLVCVSLYHPTPCSTFLHFQRFSFPQVIKSPQRI